MTIETFSQKRSRKIQCTSATLFILEIINHFNFRWSYSMQNKQRKDEPMPLKHSINFEISASLIYPAYLHSCEVHNKQFNQDKHWTKFNQNLLTLVYFKSRPLPACKLRLLRALSIVHRLIIRSKRTWW